jgi:hypothetical protein
MNELEKQKLLLKSIFKSCGGPTELQHLTQIPRQNFTNWQIRGKVPLLLAIKISKELGISKWGLNYKEFCEVDDNPIPWKEVVNSYFLPKGVVAKLLKGDAECAKKTKKLKKKKKSKKKLQEK